MTDINDFLKSEREAYKRDPEKYERERREDARREYKDVDRYQNEKLMERAERMAKSKEARTSGGGGKAGANPMKTGTLSPFNMEKGGAVRSSASKRADGCAVKGFTRAK